MALKKVKLSKNLLQMKFMKRTKEKEEVEEEKEKETTLFKDQNAKLIKEGQSFIFEPSFVLCEDLRPGRMSFKGMNPEVEKLMEEEKKSKRTEEPVNEGITSKEMAERYSTLVNTIGKKFSNKRSRNDDNGDPKINKKWDKTKFKKPRD